MKRINHIFTFSLISLLTLLPVLTSCSGEENNIIVNPDEVPFAPNLEPVQSRAYNLDNQMLNLGFAVSAFCPEDDPGQNGILSVHCEDQNVTRQADGLFRSDGCRWPGNAGGKIGSLKFFAFHPTRSEMMRRAGVGDECFIYKNATVKEGGGINYDYRLTRFRVAPDISRQVDFITSIGEGNKTDHIYSGIQLDFEHQLCGVVIGVWGNSTLYDVEIAGVRVGGTYVEADFSLSALTGNDPGEGNTIGQWIINEQSRKGYVDYVFDSGDKVVRVNTTTGEHTSREDAAPIMGNGGMAMLIPAKHAKWNHTADKTNEQGGMYFCSLIRMTRHDGDRHVIFPSTDPASLDHLVFLSVSKSDGTVMKRLDKNGNIYGTLTRYNIPDTEELHVYGWAAAPVNVDWKPGFTYSYVLNYSTGVGVHDPADPNPASPIIDYTGVEVSTTDTWGDEYILNAGWGKWPHTHDEWWQ